MSLIPNTSVVPPGGFHFVDRNGGIENRITGDSFEDVAKKVLDYRLQNNFPPGDPLAELYAYVCETWPNFCREQNPPEVPLGPKTMHITQRVASWMASAYQRLSGDGGVGQSKADARANVCAGCPHRKSFTEYGCGSCIASIERLTFVLLRDRRTEQDPMGCDILGQNNQIAVFSGEDRLPLVTDEQNEKLPNFCWRKRK